MGNLGRQDAKGIVLVIDPHGAGGERGRRRSRQ
jgi:hypothetical protein